MTPFFKSLKRCVSSGQSSGELPVVVEDHPVLRVLGVGEERVALLDRPVHQVRDADGAPGGPRGRPPRGSFSRTPPRPTPSCRCSRTAPSCGRCACRELIRLLVDRHHPVLGAHEDQAALLMVLIEPEHLLEYEWRGLGDRRQVPQTRRLSAPAPACSARLAPRPPPAQRRRPPRASRRSRRCRRGRASRRGSAPTDRPPLCGHAWLPPPPVRRCRRPRASCRAPSPTRTAGTPSCGRATRRCPPPCSPSSACGGGGPSFGSASWRHSAGPSG
mmetsp:Transcript_29019/g.75270  ORF Transcript_29019/g.75270 Transcript_29019/m.75270 type:complete len:273 (-) Transcript_29019:341-1159(-)